MGVQKYRKNLFYNNLMEILTLMNLFLEEQNSARFKMLINDINVLHNFEVTSSDLNEIYL